VLPYALARLVPHTGSQLALTPPLASSTCFMLCDDAFGQVPSGTIPARRSAGHVLHVSEWETSPMSLQLEAQVVFSASARASKFCLPTRHPLRVASGSGWLNLRTITFPVHVLLQWVGGPTTCSRPDISGHRYGRRPPGRNVCF
jgi:hypothetical protein